MGTLLAEMRPWWNRVVNSFCGAHIAAYYHRCAGVAQLLLVRLLSVAQNIYNDELRY